MGASDIFASLCQISEPRRKQILLNAIKEYGMLLSDIYNDIYESCIKVYYSSYKPTVYKRHGDISGFNLYSAFYSEINNLRIDADYMPNELLSYRGASKNDVLQTVVTGQRGLKERNMPKTGVWPKSWSVKYPNAYSQYTIWQSGQTTIEEILQDFDDTAGYALANTFWEIVSKYI